METEIICEEKVPSRWGRRMHGGVATRDITSLYSLAFGLLFAPLFSGTAYLLSDLFEWHWITDGYVFFVLLILCMTAITFVDNVSGHPMIERMARFFLKKEYKDSAPHWLFEPGPDDMVVTVRSKEIDLSLPGRKSLYGFLRIANGVLFLETSSYHVRIPTDRFDFNSFLETGTLWFEYAGRRRVFDISMEGRARKRLMSMMPMSEGPA
ncbi:MAG: hypothetical protein RLY93_11275 [Sumerlaeia bacterium]